MSLPVFLGDVPAGSSDGVYWTRSPNRRIDRSPIIVAQHDPCARPGGGGGGGGGGSDGRVCCEFDAQGRCRLWRPPNGQCP